MSDAPVTRFSISLPPDLLAQLDAMVDQRRLPSRSRAIAEMIRQGLVDRAAEVGRRIVAGTITLVYGNRRQAIRNQLARIQARYLKEVISSQHVFLEDYHSLEVLLVQGPGERLNELADALRGVKSVKQVKVALTTTVLPPLH
jgi:CopG family transcriptional regulator, nickel-responsive regulator